ncbi:NAD(P)/FAD-dependent oxidoreductase [Phaeovulum vinaykumarii]|uniref:Glycine/D-amino acid oxidase n=1 Tax=Phaeovulum vinaykumarii TaxID=407234 RepID=A0A1N7LJ92_9RHOB|nr:FAD-binding oxidoreductase [Phaeovulum vinaykumarii]SIS73900.1 Glycine/D-amino acid oxidase [Phaeovulum vinaykumarii]SOC04816.1 glycine/D-amino acid oxidase-like deaminating enzyme [Phaeovulum vinaykumarii]
MQNDFLIIGGGVAGISAAARLAPLGRVALLETEQSLGYHASGRSAALFEPRYGKRPVVELSFASEDYHARHNGGYLTPRGIMVVARPGAEAEAFEAEMAQMELPEISRDEARTILPILRPEMVARAGYATHAFDIDTDRLMADFLREARNHGAAVYTATPVQGIRRSLQGWAVTTPKGVFEGRILVNAAGAWVDRIAQMAGVAPLGFTPLRRSMARIPAPGGHDVSTWPMTLNVGETWHCKPDAGALIVSPADQDPAEPHDAWADDMVLAEGLARYEEMVTEPVTRLLANWAGLRTFAPDRVLVIGPDPTDPSFVWCAGQGGYGFQTAPGASALLADLMAGRPSELDGETVAALAPGRFRQ